MCGYLGSKAPKRKRKRWYQNPQPPQKRVKSTVHINIYIYIIYTSQLWQINSYTQKFIVKTALFLEPKQKYSSAPWQLWPPGRGRNTEVGTSKLRLFAKVGLRMGLAITWSSKQHLYKGVGGFQPTSKKTWVTHGVINLQLVGMNLEDMWNKKHLELKPCLQQNGLGWVGWLMIKLIKVLGYEVLYIQPY